MTKEQVENIWKVEESKRYTSQRIGRYAIKNVKERLELKYGRDGFLLRIESEPGKGTTVTVRRLFFWMYRCLKRTELKFCRI